MSDIVERLRACTAGIGVRDASDYSAPMTVADLVEAADEIEHLRAGLRRIINQSCETFCINPEGGANIVVDGHDRFAFEVDVKALLNIARAALGEKE